MFLSTRFLINSILACSLGLLSLSQAFADSDKKDRVLDTEAKKSSAAASQAPVIASIGPSDRPAMIQLTSDVKGKKNRPLMLVLHGYNMDAQSMNGFVQASAAASALNAFLILPEGRKDLSGKRFWDATDACCNFFSAKPAISDEDYLVSLVKEAVEKYPVDRRNIYVVGFSNGGFMANRLACNHSELFSGVASLSGANYLNPAQCQPRQPISMLQIHGTYDPLISFNGGTLVPSEPSFPRYPSAMQTTAFWAEHNKCKQQTFTAAADELSQFNIDFLYQSVSDPAELANYLDIGNETDRIDYFDCKRDEKVALWIMNGLGHAPFYKPDLLLKVIDFLEKP